jgi:hypothetical protein
MALRSRTPKHFLIPRMLTRSIGSGNKLALERGSAGRVHHNEYLHNSYGLYTRVLEEGTDIITQTNSSINSRGN